MIRLASLALALALIVSAAADGAAAPFDPLKETGIDPRPDAAIPFDLAYVDENGRIATLRQLAAGRPLLLAPVVHNCPNICGVTLSGLMDAVEQQSYRPQHEFVLVAFGIDPKEGPKEARSSLEQLRERFPQLASQGVHALTGAPADITAVTSVLGYRYAWDPTIGQFAHDAAIAVITPDGKLSRWLFGLAPRADDLKLALTEAGQGRIGNWSDHLSLLCYHYDPKTGQYSSIIRAAVRGGGAATVAALAALLTIFRLREHRRQKPSDEGRRP